jgi:perosamine synthetase
MIPPAKPYFPTADIDEIKLSLEKILASGILTLGDYTREFERQFAIQGDVRDAIAVNSATSALEIALRVHNLRLGDEVMVPTSTFGATAAATVLQVESP